MRQEKLTALGQMAGGVVHELRNPLGNIKNTAYLLDMALEEPNPEVKEALEILEGEVAKSDGIMRSLVDFARTKAPTPAQVDVNDVVREALSRVDVPESVEVTRRLDEALPIIQADADQLALAFRNIISNGIQAMSLPSPAGAPEGGRLVIKTEAVGRGDRQPEVARGRPGVAVSFADTGPGIPEGNVDKIFEPLFTTKAKGIGLGLALVKALVDGHGGTIEVESELGEGSTFRVRLPLAA